MRLPFISSLLFSQSPFISPPLAPRNYTPSTKPFTLLSGPDVFTPKDMLELPRPGTAVANPGGDLAFIPVSEYSFETKSRNSTIFITSLDPFAPPTTFPLLNGGEAFWLSSRTLAHVVPSSSGQAIFAVSLKYTAESPSLLSLAPDSPTLIGHLPPTPASNFRYDAKSSTLVFSASTYVNADLFSTPDIDAALSKAQSGTSAMVYDTGYPRHWDTWRTQGKENQLFAVKLGQVTDDAGEGKWALGSEYFAPLNGTGHYTPVEPFGGTDDFDISSTHIVYTAIDPELRAPWHNRQNIYIVPTDGSEKPRQLTTGKQGSTHSPVFSKQGDKVAWLELRKEGHEADRARIMIYDLKKDVRFGITEKWDRSPGSLVFSPDGSHLFLTAGDYAREKAFTVSVPSTPSVSISGPLVNERTPVSLTNEHSVSGVQPLADGRVLFTQSSLTRPNEVFILGNLSKTDEPLYVEQITHLTANGLKGKSLSAGEEFYFEGAEGKEVQGWVVKPPGFESGVKSKWPMIFLIHGGPQSAWEDSWSTRWNPNVFAQQGYVVVSINPTGSTSFGQEFTDAISGDWGGKPFVDLQAGYKYILQQYPEIDAERTVAAGASWGGYAINWIAGHPEYEFNFKALVCHDGVFDARNNGFASDELFFFDHEFGGPPWTNKKLLEKMNPSTYVEKWSVPMLIFHGEKDFRLPVTEGIGAFHANQRMGVPSRLVVFPEENHWVLDPGNNLKWHTEIFEWFAKWLD